MVAKTLQNKGVLPPRLGQSHVGVKGWEPIASNWSLVFKFESGFDPFTLERANRPKSLVQNNTTPLGEQTANGDSSRAGQLFTYKMTPFHASGQSSGSAVRKS